MGPSPYVVFACKTAAFGAELQLSMGSRPHLSFSEWKNSVNSIRITSLYGSQPSSLDFGCKTAPFWPEQVSMGPRHILSFCACKTACLEPELIVSIGPSPHQWFLPAKQRLLDQNYKSLWVPDLTCRFVHEKGRDWHLNEKSIWVPALICGSFHAKQRL